VAFASVARFPYRHGMAIFLRPASPKVLAGDMWTYFRENRPHKWPLLGLSMAITWVIIWAFIVDGNTNTMPTRNKIIYFQSWNENRTDAAIILQQKIDLAKYDVALQGKQKEMQHVADLFGIDWRKDEARNSARRKEALKEINAELDARLAKAKLAEQAAAKTAPVQKP
jgi:hypothetical protein